MYVRDVMERGGLDLLINLYNDGLQRTVLNELTLDSLGVFFYEPGSTVGLSFLSNPANDLYVLIWRTLTFGPLHVIAHLIGLP